MAGTWSQGTPLPLALSRTTDLPEKLAKRLRRQFGSNLESLEGFWSGTISGAGLFVYLEIAPTGSAHHVFLFSPLQTPFPIDISELTLDGKDLTFEVPLVGGSFSGKLSGKEQVEGQWNQGTSLDLTLKHASERPSP